MRIPKKLGEYKIEHCFFCEKQAMTRNHEKVPVCLMHKAYTTSGLKCSCGAPLETKQGKFGTFFLCMHCGPLNIKKVKEMNGL